MEYCEAPETVLRADQEGLRQAMIASITGLVSLGPRTEMQTTPASFAG